MSCSKNQTDCCFQTNSARVALRIDGVLSGLTSSKSRLLKNMSTHSRFAILTLINADQNVTQEKSTVLTKIYCMYINTVANKCMRICWIFSLSAIYACIVCVCACVCVYIACVYSLLAPSCTSWFVCVYLFCLFLHRVWYVRVRVSMEYPCVHVVVV